MVSHARHRDEARRTQHRRPQRRTLETTIVTKYFALPTARNFRRRPPPPNDKLTSSVAQRFHPAPLSRRGCLVEHKKHVAGSAGVVSFVLDAPGPYFRKRRHPFCTKFAFPVLLFCLALTNTDSSVQSAFLRFRISF